MSIQKNLDQIFKNIEEARKKSKTKENIKLVAVSKTVSADRIKEAIDYGVIDFGENKVQELEFKYDILKEEKPRFHMIGHLQSNKVKDVIDKAVLIHSLDRNSLIKEMEKRGERNNRIIKTLIQLNISKEKTKSGVFLEDLDGFINIIEKCQYIKVLGLMTMAPYYDDPELARPVFRKAREVFNDLSKKEYKNINMKYLSMGMSNDYEVAIEEGSNLVRIGSSIFGKRDYN